nr:MAG TPA: hypothetical protein [Caudoviricetes sp.]
MAVTLPSKEKARAFYGAGLPLSGVNDGLSNYWFSSSAYTT